MWKFARKSEEKSYAFLDKKKQEKSLTFWDKCRKMTTTIANLFLLAVPLFYYFVNAKLMLMLSPLHRITFPK